MGPPLVHGIAMEKGARSYLGQVFATGGMQVSAGGMQATVGRTQVTCGWDAGGSLSCPARLLEVIFQAMIGSAM